VPVPPSEVTIRFSIPPLEEQDEQPHIEAGLAAARASGRAVETGPSELALTGGRDETIDVLRSVIVAALDAGARSLNVTVEAATESTDP
jgi:hypothetical protein